LRRLGRRLARELHRQCRVIGLDRRPFPIGPATSSTTSSICGARGSGRVREGVSAVVHLGVMHDPARDSADNHAINMTGMQKLLEYVEHFGIKKVVLLSSANVYGPRPDNPQFLTRTPAARRGPFSQIRDLSSSTCARSRSSGASRASDRDSCVRRTSSAPCSNAPSNYLRLSGRGPTLLGFDPMLQAVHQDDVVRAIMLALSAHGARHLQHRRTPARCPLSRVLELPRAGDVAVPHTVARLGVERLFRWRVTSFPGARARFHPLRLHDRRRARAAGSRLRSPRTAPWPPSARWTRSDGSAETPRGVRRVAACRSLRVRARREGRAAARREPRDRVGRAGRVGALAGGTKRPRRGLRATARDARGERRPER
jgi:UDP-glucose 4-epimerase